MCSCDLCDMKWSSEAERLREWVNETKDMKDSETVWKCMVRIVCILCDTSAYWCVYSVFMWWRVINEKQKRNENKNQPMKQNQTVNIHRQTIRMNFVWITFFISLLRSVKINDLTF